jgi:hypothetical protein
VPFVFDMMAIAVRDSGVCFLAVLFEVEVPERMPALTFHTREDADKKGEERMMSSLNR